MGSGTKITHQNYTVTPAAPVDEPKVEDIVLDDDALEAKMATEDNAIQIAHEESKQEIWNSLPPEEVMNWKTLGLPAEEALEWYGMGMSPDLAYEWDQSGFDPTTANKYIEKGLNSVQATVEEFEEKVSEVATVTAEETSENVTSEVSPFDSESIKISDAAWEDAVTPIPETIEVGDPNGVALLIGGADIDGSSATIMAYADPKGGEAREVLFTTITPEAEAKLLEALAPTEEKLIPQTVEVEKSGVISYDTENQIFDNLKTAAISVNHHMKEGDGFPEHTIDRINEMDTLVKAALASDDDEVKKMGQHYESTISALKERIQPDYSEDYYEGGKIPQVVPFETVWKEEETQWIKDPSQGPTGGDKLEASARAAGRVKAEMVDGVVQWDGKKRSKAGGIEYIIELPDGYKAVYHPYVYDGQSLSSDPYSLRGQLELHCPGGEGHAKELVDVLGSLNIVNRPMNHSEGEWTYLMKNIEAQGLGEKAEVSKAVSDSAAFVEHVNQTLLYDKHKDEAIALYQANDMDGIEKLGRKIALESEAAALPRRVRMVRDAIAKATGHANGKELEESSAYNPVPRRSGGWMVFDRFDVANKKEELSKVWQDKVVYCSVTGKGSGGSLVDIFKNGGVLASTERRQIMGITVSTMSPGADMTTGGAKSVFLRAGNSSEHSNSIVWDKPVERLLKRTDWYAFGSDHFGSINPGSSHSTKGLTRNPGQVAGFTGNSGNEIMFQDGLDLLGADAPSRVNCSSKSERDQIRKILKDRGITHIGTKLVTDVIVSD